MPIDKKSKEYEYYSMKLPLDLKNLFEKYLEMNKALGFRNVSQYVLHLCQDDALRIIDKYPELSKILQKED